ncbi:MAG: dUTP diphosphatase [Bacteroidota bacterium]|jgi:dUTP pyrophosphatase
MHSNIKVRIARINADLNDIPLPTYATEGSSGMDIHAAVEGEMTVKPGETVLVPSGFQLEIPQGFEAQVRPRSGLAIKHGVGILNAPGTIDSDYRGELKIILTNFGKNDFVIRRGDRVAQLVIAPVVRAQWEEVKSVDRTPRGSGGFGHTGQ